MKTVSFITIHVAINFGSKLQTIATSEILKKMGFNPVCVNYVPPRITNTRYWKDAWTSPIKFIKRLLFYPFYSIAEHNFSVYLSKYCKLSKPFYSEDDFEMNCPKADIYISGSDQIWNYQHNEGKDIHYFFDGINGKKIAYASSIGMTTLPEDYMNYLKEQLSQFKAISVREQSAVELLEKLGINAVLVLDPTFMLDKEDWMRFASKRIIKEPYLFVYLPYNIKDKTLVYRSARKIAMTKKLKVVAYSDFFIKEKLADKTIFFVNPGDVLSLILYADVVITNSFHGTAFSINLNKQFWTYLPTGFPTRITNILTLCGLNRRLLEKEITKDQIGEVVDFKNTNDVLQYERQHSYDFLTQALQ